MNGGLCERIYSGAKSNLDNRMGDSTDVSVTLSKEDVIAACKALPPPPEPSGGGEPAGENAGGRVPDGWVPQELVDAEAQS